MPKPKLYELTNKAGLSMSPFVWRTKFALKEKDVTYETVPVSFFDIPRIAEGVEPALKTVPIIEADGRFIGDSWTIAEQLDVEYPASAPLFSSPAELSMVKFFDKWFGTQVLPLMFRACVFDIYERVRPAEQDYFRISREAIFGQTLEQVAADSGSDIERLRAGLLPLRLALRHAPYLGGRSPNYADFIGWAAFVAFAPAATKPFLAPDDPLRIWVSRGTDFAQLARSDK